jgi:hypothetical protein
MKRKTEDGTPPFAVRLPRELQDRLRRAGGERGIGEEIRRRLEASFEVEKAPANPKTRNLLIATGFVAEKAAMYFGDWSEDPFAFEILKAGVNLWLIANQPKGEPIMKPNPNREPFDSFFDPSSTPENIARSILANLTWLREEKLSGVRRDELVRQLTASVEAKPGRSVQTKGHR